METEALKELWTLCFGDEGSWIDAFLSTALDPRHTCLLTRQGKLAAALAWMDVQCDGRKLAYLYAIATHPDCRGQGLCRELMGKAHGGLAAQGYGGTILVPADAGLRNMYAKMGYENFGGIREFSAMAERPVSLRKVTAAEYARLRKGLLPAGGVVQEDGAIAYLEKSADLYAGEDFLLAAAPEEGQLMGIELLGSRKSAGGILGALGYEKGVLRTPGGDKPFAMYRPLTQDRWTPGYFGLAFE